MTAAAGAAICGAGAIIYMIKELVPTPLLKKLEGMLSGMKTSEKSDMGDMGGKHKKSGDHSQRPPPSDRYDPDRHPPLSHPLPSSLFPSPSLLPLQAS